MFRKLWRWWQRLWQKTLGQWRRQRPQPTPAIPSRLSDAEYEVLFLQLLEGVDQGWQSPQILAALGDRVEDPFLLKYWLPSFASRLLADPTQHRLLAERMLRLEAVGCGELGRIAGMIAGELLAPPTPEPQASQEVESQLFNEMALQFYNPSAEFQSTPNPTNQQTKSLRLPNYQNQTLHCQSNPPASLALTRHYPPKSTASFYLRVLLPQNVANFRKMWNRLSRETPIGLCRPISP
jgi:hypothetical protein